MSMIVEKQKQELNAIDSLPPAAVKPFSDLEVEKDLAANMLREARFSHAFRAFLHSPGETVEPKKLLADNGISVLNTNAFRVGGLENRLRDLLFLEETPDVLKQQERKGSPGEREEVRKRRRSAKEVMEDFWRQEAERKSRQHPRIARVKLDPPVETKTEAPQTDAEKAEIALLSARHGAAPQETERPHFEAQDAARNADDKNILNTPFSDNSNGVLRLMRGEAQHAARRAA